VRCASGGSDLRGTHNPLAQGHHVGAGPLHLEDGARGAVASKPNRQLPAGDMGAVPTVHVVKHTALDPERVLESARDFSARCAEFWPDVHMEHLEVHRTGENFAEVTPPTLACLPRPRGIPGQGRGTDQAPAPQ
jgi:hypothetical protein